MPDDDATCPCCGQPLPTGATSPVRLTAYQARLLLNCHPSTLRRYYHVGLVTGERINRRRIMYDRASVLALCRPRA